MSATSENAEEKKLMKGMLSTIADGLTLYAGVKFSSGDKLDSLLSKGMNIFMNAFPADIRGQFEDFSVSGSYEVLGQTKKFGRKYIVAASNYIIRFKIKDETTEFEAGGYSLIDQESGLVAMQESATKDLTGSSRKNISRSSQRCDFH